MKIRSMHDAVQIIGRAVGVSDLAANATGAFELVFFDQLPVYFQIVGDTEVEVYSPGAPSRRTPPRRSIRAGCEVR